MLFHVQESVYNPETLKELIADSKLQFRGFVFDDEKLQEEANRIGQELFSERFDLLDLGQWKAIENKEPRLFAGMYTFYLQA